MRGRRGCAHGARGHGRLPGGAKQARRATWERAKALQVLALAGLAQEGEDQRASLGSLAALPERSRFAPCRRGDNYVTGGTAV